MFSLQQRFEEENHHPIKGREKQDYDECHRSQGVSVKVLVKKKDVANCIKEFIQTEPQVLSLFSSEKEEQEAS
jgi:hypothetical protein